MTGARMIVSGGSGALGRAVVAALLHDGARVAVPYRQAAAWDALRASHPTDCLWGASADLADPTAAGRFVEQAVGWLGRLDGVAALAGAYAGAGPLEQAPESEWEHMLRANLQTTWALARAALPHLLEHGGSIVTVGSRAVETLRAGAAAYAVSKAGVHALTRALAVENQARGVRVNCVVPGVIDTPENRRAMPRADHSRWPAPEEIARVVLFLLSPASAPVTGALVPVPGRS